MNNKFIYPITLSILALTSSAIAGGLMLPQIGTAESTATAGVSNVTNNRDASAVITNPGALSGIENSSLILGIQYLNVNNDFEREDGRVGTNGSSGQFMPHISYAKRLNEQWVVGIASHVPGGLGINYDHGLIGGNETLTVVDNNMITILNVTTSASFLINENLSLGGSLIAQYVGVKSELNTPSPTEVTGSDWSPSFALSGLYQMNERNQLGLTYNYGAQHDVNVEVSTLEGTTSLQVNWPQSLELGLRHQLSTELALMVSANFQQWSEFSKGYDDTYGAGVAMSYQLDKWTLHTGFSADTSPLNSDSRGYVLPLDEQWRLGFGGEKMFNNGMRVGGAYQYQSLGDAEIRGSDFSNGEYIDNRVHFITGSLTF